MMSMLYFDRLGLIKTAPIFLSLLSLLSRIGLIACVMMVLSACQGMPSKNPAPVAASDAPSVALVLGGGGTKGLAHVGVIQALEDNGIRPDIVVGTSAGSVIGSLYASGMSPDQLARVALTTPDAALIDFTLSHQGFIEGTKLKNFINDQVNHQVIEDFPIRFAAVAAEKHTLKKAVFTTGNAGLAVQASSSVPNIFIAPRIPENGGKKYIDGGVVSLTPVDSAFDLGADMVIAVDVTATDKSSNTLNATIFTSASLSSFWGLLEQNLTTASANKSSSELARADIIITPKVGHISSLDTRQRRALIEAGKDATLPKIEAIKQVINKQGKYAVF